MTSERPAEITLYTKPGCHLCDAVEQVIAQVARRRPITLKKVNILDDPDAKEKYRHEIPVVFLGGREIARHRLTTAELGAALDQTPE
jgi:glutaredoxin